MSGSRLSFQQQGTANMWKSISVPGMGLDQHRLRDPKVNICGIKARAHEIENLERLR